MWISEPTPVISRTKVIDSWSSWKATSARKPPTGIQLYRCWCRARCSGLLPSMSTKRAAPMANEATANSEPIQWPARSRRLPPHSSRAAPTSGAATSRAIKFSTLCDPLQLHRAGVVDGGRMTGAADRHADRQADRDLGRGGDHREEGDDLAVEIPVHPREGHEGEIAGVEHQL